MAGEPGPQPHHLRLKKHHLMHSEGKLFVVGFLQTSIGALLISSDSIKQNLDILKPDYFARVPAVGKSIAFYVKIPVVPKSLVNMYVRLFGIV